MYIYCIYMYQYNITCKYNFIMTYIGEYSIAERLSSSLGNVRNVAHVGGITLPWRRAGLLVAVNRPHECSYVVYSRRGVQVRIQEFGASTMQIPIRD